MTDPSPSPQTTSPASIGEGSSQTPSAAAIPAVSALQLTNAQSTKPAQCTESATILPSVSDADSAPSLEPISATEYDPFDFLTPTQKLVLAKSRSLLSLPKGLKSARVKWNVHVRWMREKYYREAVRNFELEMASVVVGTLYDRAINGLRKPVIYQGEITTWYREHDNSLLWKLATAVGPAELRAAASRNRNGGKPEVVVQNNVQDNRVQFITQVSAERQRRAIEQERPEPEQNGSPDDQEASF